MKLLLFAVGLIWNVSTSALSETCRKEDNEHISIYNIELPAFYCITNAANTCEEIGANFTSKFVSHQRSPDLIKKCIKNTFNTTSFSNYRGDIYKIKHQTLLRIIICKTNGKLTFDKDNKNSLLVKFPSEKTADYSLGYAWDIRYGFIYWEKKMLSSIMQLTFNGTVEVWDIKGDKYIIGKYHHFKFVLKLSYQIGWYEDLWVTDVDGIFASKKYIQTNSTQISPLLQFVGTINYEGFLESKNCNFTVQPFMNSSTIKTNLRDENNTSNNEVDMNELSTNSPNFEIILNDAVVEDTEIQEKKIMAKFQNMKLLMSSQEKKIKEIQFHFQYLTVLLLTCLLCGILIWIFNVSVNFASLKKANSRIKSGNKYYLINCLTQSSTNCYLYLNHQITDGIEKKKNEKKTEDELVSIQNQNMYKLVENDMYGT